MIQRGLRLVISSAIVTTLVGCGSGEGGGPVAAPTPTPTSVARDSFGCVAGTWMVSGGSPDGTRYQTEHFAFHWSGTSIPDSDAVRAGEVLERAYAFYASRVGFAPPQCESASKNKINVNAFDGNGISTAGSRGGVGYIDISAFGLATPRTAAHELVHVFQSSTPGWTVLPRSFWETHANFMVAQIPDFRDDADCAEDAVNSAYLAHGNARTQYCGWPFWDYVAQKHGYAAVNAIWTQPGASDQYAALAANRGWSASQMNDEFAAWAIRNVTWDYTGPDGFDRGAVFRSAFGPHEPDTAIPYRARRLTTLEPVDLARRRFAVPAAWAPQRWGYNMVRLVPDAGSTSLTVAFRGIVQDRSATTALPGAANEPQTIPAPNSGWRWSVVVVDAQGAPRYTRVLQGGDESLTVTLRADDRAAYLMVMAAPTALQTLKDDQPYYAVYRYPWMVQVEGAMPWGYQANAPDRIAGGRRHANGGGWVGPGASVAATAYVGPYARVYGGTVTGSARIEDHSFVASGTIGDNARIDALTTLAGTFALRDNAHIGSVFRTIAGNDFILSGTAQLLGDAQIAGDNRQLDAPVFTGFSRGVYYGLILQSDGNDPAKGSNRTEAVQEVTARPTYSWR